MFVVFVELHHQTSFKRSQIFSPYFLFPEPATEKEETPY